MNLSPRKKLLIVGLTTIVILIVSIALVSVLKYVIFPLINQNLQSDILWVAGAFVFLAILFAALVTISGYSLKDFFSISEHTSKKRETVRVDGLSTNDKSVQSVAVVAKQSAPTPKIDRKHIQRLLDNTELRSGVNLLQRLDSCLELCTIAGLTGKYGKWINMELSGYDNMEEFRKTFGDEDEYNAWMKIWTSHRWIDSYVKVPSRGGSGTEQRKLATPKVMIKYSVVEIDRIIHEKQDLHLLEASIPLLELDGNAQRQIREACKKANYDIPQDARAFFNLSFYMNILSAVGGKILSLRTEAESIISTSRNRY